MSSEKDKGDESFSQFKFLDAYRWYLKARDVLYLSGKEDQLRDVEIKIARCCALLGSKAEAIDILEELAEQTKERILIEEYYLVILELAATLFAYGDYERGKIWLEELEEEQISEENPQIFFRFWQTKAQLKIVYHQLEDAREIVHFLKKKAKTMGNEPYFYELQVLEAQIDAEEGDVLKAYTSVDEAFKYFQDSPFERSAFEKKIILSQFVSEPEETIDLMDEYLERYQPDDFHPLIFNTQRVELELRSERITAEEAVEKGERLILTAESIDHLELTAKIKRLMAGLYQSTGNPSDSYKSFEKAKQYFLDQNLEYEEAVTIFIYLPALLQFHSARLLGLTGYLGGPKGKGSSQLEKIDIPTEIDRIIEIFERYDDKIRAKMAQFFQLSYKISSIGIGSDLKGSLNEISDIYQWMLDKGELHYSEMIGQFLELVKQFR
ncbi:MAG: hypothetical protein H7644_10610 [Candidatus Heimdallarchaeota archaeon]|nr:hypothetical protein [Candidatus Heimdallarchaeota archaeon]MCK5144208.1 hypothetical protein [Candidatus Heimdallarchaeota archaeon]